MCSWDTGVGHHSHTAERQGDGCWRKRRAGMMARGRPGKEKASGGGDKGPARASYRSHLSLSQSGHAKHDKDKRGVSRKGYINFLKPGNWEWQRREYTIPRFGDQPPSANFFALILRLNRDQSPERHSDELSDSAMCSHHVDVHQVRVNGSME
jgi:hypothetical protein